MTNATVRTLPFLTDAAELNETDVENRSKKAEFLSMVQTKMGSITKPADLRMAYMRAALRAQALSGQHFAAAKAGNKTAWAKVKVWAMVRDAALEAHDNVCGVRWYERSEPHRKATIEMISKIQEHRPVVVAIETVAEEIHELRKDVKNFLGKLCSDVLLNSALIDEMRAASKTEKTEKTDPKIVLTGEQPAAA